MVRRDGAETRRQRITEMNRALTNIPKEGVSLTKFVAVQMLNTGLTETKVMEYLEVIEKTGNIKIDKVGDRIRELKKI